MSWPDEYQKLVHSIFGRSFDELEEKYGEIDKFELADVLDHVLREHLTTRGRGILSMRSGLSKGNPLTLKEVGEHWQISPERVRQIESKALWKLRHPHVFGSKGLQRAVKGSDLYRKPWPSELPENRGMYPNPAVIQLTWGILHAWGNPRAGGGRYPAFWNAGNPLRGTVESVLEWLNRAIFDRADGPLNRKFLELHITRALLGLEPFDFAVMCYRYGFITGERMIQREAGRMCGIGGSRVGDIQKKCIPQLAEAMRKSMVRELKHEKGLPVVLPDAAPRGRFDVHSPPNWGRM